MFHKTCGILLFEAIAGVKDISGSSPTYDLIGVVKHDNCRSVILGTFVGEEAKRHDRKAVAFFAEVGDGSVEHDGATSAWGGDGVGLEAVAVRLVAYQNFLEGRNATGFEEFLVDRHAALIVHVRIGDDCAVDFGAEKMFEHWWNLVALGLKNQSLA